MLIASSKVYKCPIKQVYPDGRVAWLIGYKGSSRLDMITAEAFKYTIIRDESDDRLTFEFDGDHIKPAMRTLRVYGSQRCADFIKVFMNEPYEAEKKWALLFAKIRTEELLARSRRLANEAHKVSNS